MHALEIQNLTKIYNNKFQALQGIDLRIQEGDFFALLGSNGAGKTTIINIIAGLLNKTSGEIKAFGMSQNADKNSVKRLVGLMPQEFNFNPFEPIEEILINQAGYYGIAKKTATKRAVELLKEMQLFAKRKEMAKSLSGGMKRRLMLARALMHSPRILILDEPTAGVDVEIRKHLWEFLKKLNNTGTTIILTTHYLEEAEQLCRNIAIIDKGKVIESSPMKALLAKANNSTIQIETTTAIEQIDLDDIFTKIDAHTLHTEIGTHTNVSDIITLLHKKNIQVKTVNNLENRLENLFVALTKKNNEDSI
jgi:ABC-2 type transport system ATP-binding protein